MKQNDDILLKKVNLLYFFYYIYKTLRSFFLLSLQQSYPG